MKTTLRSYLTKKLNRAIEATNTPEEVYKFIQSQIAQAYFKYRDGAVLDFWIEKAVSHKKWMDMISRYPRAARSD